METLELLEERLLEYSGTILLVSHDRELLNNVVTSTLVFEAGGIVREYPGGYDDWLRQRPNPADPKKADGARATVKPKPEKRPPPKDRPRKLTFKEGKELEALPARIEGLEQEQKRLDELMVDPEFYRVCGEKISLARSRINELIQELEEAYGRWEELASIREANP
jgi:ATP-binding cassette subfamily F protein uup